MQALLSDSLIPISVATLTPHALVGVNVYLRPSLQAVPVLFCAGDELPDIRRLAPLVGSGGNKLFISAEDRSAYQRYLRANWTTLIADESTPLPNRLAILSETMRAVLCEEFTSGDTDRIVEASRMLGEGMCELFTGRHVVAYRMIDVLHHDYATFTHSTNVAVYCCLLARELGFSAPELIEIAIGGLLHDIGKLHIDEQILCKPGRLNKAESREIRRHPTAGYCELADRSDVSYGQLMMCYQHHERLNGSGYPVGCRGAEIHAYAKICAIADVFEALTSERPYRKSIVPRKAWEVLRRGERTEFDPEMLRCWQALTLPPE